MTHDLAKITKRNLLAKNTLYSLLGQGAPVLFALFSIPLLIDGLGIDRFGVLTLAWMVTGYFSLFDLGVGRALTKMVAEKLGEGRAQKIPALVWTAMLLMFLTGLLGTLLVSAISPYLVHEVLKIPQEFQAETVQTLYLLAMSIPIVISSACLLGVLAACQRFDFVNAVRIPIGALTFLGPLLVLHFSQSILYIVSFLVAVRLVELLANLLLCFRVIPALRYDFVVQLSLMKSLMHFGGWMTVSNIVGPLMAYLDRFLIVSMVSIGAVVFYATPYEMVSRLMIIPGALAGVLFPAFSASFVQDRNYTTLIFCRGAKYIFITLFPIILITVTLAHEVLELWLGSEFAQHSTHTLQWMAAGVLITSQAYLPFALVQAGGRPDLTAKLHIIGVPFYALFIWWLIKIYGIEGAAFAWVVRGAIDTLILFSMSHQLLSISSSSINWFAGFAIGTVVLLLIAVALPMDMALKGLFLFLTLLAFALFSWLRLLAQEERLFVCNHLMKLKRFNFLG